MEPEIEDTFTDELLFEVLLDVLLGVVFLLGAFRKSFSLAKNIWIDDDDKLDDDVFVDFLCHV